ncbi:hypothetical protein YASMINEVIRUS_1394 [Yasminevirus sp. GU-2018]|uniref:Peptidase S8/S53 domain-containing protein n=1 Tax=Yasminevirus sp. GU-2018 TaxID=2420051 RepID=A0A5K0UB87_9VIRU|nr:hypothetical protein YASMINEVIRUS_1394 [Yasminevirus sp. GU-2018]
MLKRFVKVVSALIPSLLFFMLVMSALTETVGSKTVVATSVVVNTTNPVHASTFSLATDKRVVVFKDIKHSTFINISSCLTSSLPADYGVKTNFSTNTYKCPLRSTDLRLQNQSRLFDAELEMCKTKFLETVFDHHTENALKVCTQQTLSEEDLKYSVYRPPNIVLNSYDYVNIKVPSEAYHLDLLTSKDLELDGIYQRPVKKKCCRFDEYSTTNNEECDGQCVYVIVLDTGVSKVSELQGVLDSRYEWPIGHKDQVGHGTFCASMINSKSTGINPNAVIVSVKLLEQERSDDVNRIIETFNYLLKLGTSDDSPCSPSSKCIISMSFIDEDSYGNSNSLLRDLLDRVAQTNSYIMFSSAGNQGENSCKYTPGNNENVINIGSVRLSNKGYATKSRFSNWGSCVDFWFFGEDISAAANTDGYMAIMSGTSMTNPTAAAIASIYLDTHPDASTLEVVKFLEQSSKECKIRGLDQDSSGRNYILGLNPTLRADYPNRTPVKRIGKTIVTKTKEDQNTSVEQKNNDGAKVISDAKGANAQSSKSTENNITQSERVTSNTNKTSSVEGTSSVVSTFLMEPSFQFLAPPSSSVECALTPTTDRLRQKVH